MLFVKSHRLLDKLDKKKTTGQNKHSQYVFLGYRVIVIGMFQQITTFCTQNNPKERKFKHAPASKQKLKSIKTIWLANL